MNPIDFSKIQLLALDVDGVLTDGKLYLGPDGSEFKVFHVHDGQGIKLLMKAGISVAIISSRYSEATENRIKELGVLHYALGEENKIQALEKILAELNVDFSQTAYMGDDWPDYAVMQKVALPIAVANATDPIKNLAKWQTQKCGGEGAVREMCDLLLVKKCAAVTSLI